jgi:hypothetical protein
MLIGNTLIVAVEETTRVKVLTSVCGLYVTELGWRCGLETTEVQVRGVQMRH